MKSLPILLCALTLSHLLASAAPNPESLSIEEAEPVDAPPKGLHILRLNIPHLNLAQDIVQRNGGTLRVRFELEGMTVLEACGLLADAGFSIQYPSPIMAIATPPAETYATQERARALQSEITRLSAELAKLRSMNDSQELTKNSAN
jgi:hypothetical protein